ncbi:small acid-soluble spore protein P [Paenibacillus abyssi]|uniref:Spore protein n=1 Tax=Paenibacillus abyssi TaxID=1340531 RepID=A0A917G7E2_9BACL|nr:small acid-soluble spore protein P [Paenibacillus abyssi]GGG26339.1 hypothetical protein GCM10010916_48420 [Paenibacillus abyssi]
MGKPKSQPVPGAQEGRQREHKHSRGQQEPLSGSKAVKQQNHSRHNNGEG